VSVWPGWEVGWWLGLGGLAWVGMGRGLARDGGPDLDGLVGMGALPGWGE